MVLGFLVHAGPRVLKVGTCYGPVVHSCRNSILAGDQQSVSWTRALLFELLEQLSLVDPEYPCFVHVDDLSHVLVAETSGELKTKLLKAGRTVGSEVKRLLLTLSDKSTLLPQNEITRAVAATLAAEGIPLKTAVTCDDVGIQMSGSKTRKAKTLNCRTKIKEQPGLNARKHLSTPTVQQ